MLTLRMPDGTEATAPIAVWIAAIVETLNAPTLAAVIGQLRARQQQTIALPSSIALPR